MFDAIKYSTLPPQYKSAIKVCRLLNDGKFPKHPVADPGFLREGANFRGGGGVPTFYFGKIKNA